MAKTVNQLEFALTQLCNYRCSYCWIWGDEDHRIPDLHRQHRKYAANLDLFNKVAPYLTDDAKITLIGGEITLMPWLPRLLEHMRRTVPQGTFAFTTNLSREGTVSEIIFFLPVKQEWGCSFHDEETTKEEFAAAFQRTFFPVRKGIDAWVSVIAHPGRFEEMIETVEFFAAQGIPVDLVPFSGIYDKRNYPVAYTAPQRARIAALRPSDQGLSLNHSLSAAEVDALQMGYAKPRMCSAGRDYLFITPYGKVTRCPSFDDELEEPLDAPALCTAPKCPCGNLWQYIEPGFQGGET